MTRLELNAVVARVWPLSKIVDAKPLRGQAHGQLNRKGGWELVLLDMDGLESGHAVDANGHPFCHDECEQREATERQKFPTKCRVRVEHDTRRTTPVQIETYLHCSQCLRERPADQSPKEWARTQVGMTATGQVQVVCTRHELNVTLMTMTAKEVD